MKAHVENSKAQTHALQPFSHSPQPARIRNKLAPPGRIADQERTGNRNNSVLERRLDYARRTSRKIRPDHTEGIERAVRKPHRQPIHISKTGESHVAELLKVRHRIARKPKRRFRNP